MFKLGEFGGVRMMQTLEVILGSTPTAMAREARSDRRSSGVLSAQRSQSSLFGIALIIQEMLKRRSLCIIRSVRYK